MNEQFPSIFSEKRQKLKDLSFRVTAVVMLLATPWEAVHTAGGIH